MRKIIWFFLPLIMTACSGGLVEVVVDTYIGGVPKHEKFYKVEGSDSLLVQEVYYYQNHTKRMEGVYPDDSVNNGIWIYWYENGKKNYEIELLNGKPAGDFQVWDIEGNLLPVSEYSIMSFDNRFPKIMRFFRMEEGKKVLIWEIHYYENRSKRAEGPVKQGKKYGKWVAWFDSGIKWSEGTFKYEVSHGKRTVWHDNGQKYYEGEYFFGDRSGVWQFWNSEGEFLKEIDYSKQK